MRLRRTLYACPRCSARSGGRARWTHDGQHGNGGTTVVVVTAGSASVGVRRPSPVRRWSHVDDGDVDDGDVDLGGDESGLLGDVACDAVADCSGDLLHGR